jgi:hypothetical protein
MIGKNSPSGIGSLTPLRLIKVDKANFLFSPMMGKTRSLDLAEENQVPMMNAGIYE